MRTTSAIVVSFVLLATTPRAVSQSANDQRPTFRGGVDVILVDVTVLDKRGRPVAGLAPSDFTARVSKKDRRVVGLDYVTAGSRATDLIGAALGVAPAAGAAEPRWILFAVDTDAIRAGEGRGALATIGQYLDRLGPSDHVGLVSLPTLTPRVDFTLDRAAVRTALGKIAGMASGPNNCWPTLGEAAAYANGDREASAAYRQRVQAFDCRDAARFFQMAVAEYTHRTRRLLEALSSIAVSMETKPGRRIFVLVSEGLFSYSETQSLIDDFAAIAARARLVLYGLHLNVSLMDVSAFGPTAMSRTFDNRYGFNGMAEAAVAAGGSALRAVGVPTDVLARIDAETSGYYLLALERDKDDLDGRALRIEVKVNRRGLDVRVRRSVVPGK
jgi:VWFA-related protein